MFEAEDGFLPAQVRGFGAQQQSAWLHVWLGDESAGVIEVRNEAAEVVARLSVGGFRGLHEVEWNLEQELQLMPPGQGFSPQTRLCLSGKLHSCVTGERGRKFFGIHCRSSVAFNFR